MPDDTSQNEPDNRLANREARNSDTASESDETMSLAEVLASVAESGQQEVIEAIATLQMRVGAPLDRSLLDKLDSEHLADMIAMQSDARKLEFEDRKNSRWMLVGFAVFCIVMAFGFGVFLVLNQRDSLLADLITKLAFGLGGFGAGWGSSEYFRRRRR